MPKQPVARKESYSDDGNVDSKEEVLKALDYFTDGKDQIDTEQLRYILTTFGTPMTEAEVKEILEISEVAGKPGVSTSQFVEFWAEQ